MRVQLILELLDRVSRPMRGIQAAMNGLAGADVAQRVQVARAAASNQLAMAQSNMLGAVATAAAVAAPIGKAVSQFNTYEDALSDIGIKTGQTQAQMLTFGETVRAQARALNMSSVDILKGVDTLAAGGLSFQDATALFPVLGRTALATKSNIDDLSKSSLALVDNLKILPADVQRAFDVMSQAGRDGRFEMNDMASFFPKLASTYAAAGQTGIQAAGDIAAAMQVIRKNTGTPGVAATYFEQMIKQMTTPAEVTKKAFEGAGIDIVAVMDEAQKSGRVLETIFETINKATGGNQAKIGDFIRNSEAAGGVRALVQHYEEFERIRKTALASGGVVDLDFARRIALGVEKARALNVAFSELGTTLGQAFAPMSNAAAERMTEIVWTLQTWAKANPELVSTIAMVATGVTGLMVALAALGVFVAALKVGVLSLYTPLMILWAPIGLLISFFGGMFSAISAGVAAVGGWGAAFGIVAARIGGALSWLVAPLAMVGRAFMALGAAMMATPVGMIIGAIALIAGGAYLIYRNWDRLGPLFSQVLTGIGEGLSSAWEGVYGVFAGIGTRIIGALGRAWAQVEAWFMSLSWPALPSFSAVLGDIFGPILSALSGAWSSVTGWFSGLSWPSLPAFPDFLPDFQKAFDGVIGWLGNWGGRVVDAFSGALGKITGFVENVAGRIGNLLTPITGALGKISDFMFGPSETTVKASAEQAAAAKAAIDAIGPAAEAAVAAAKATFAGISFYDSGVAMMTTLADGIKAGAASAVAAARATVQQIRDHLPHSPAKVGPLSDLDRVQFGQTLAQAITAGSPHALAAVQALTAGMAGALPASLPSPAMAAPIAGVSSPASPAFAEPGSAKAATASAGSSSGREASATTVNVTYQVTVQGGNGADVLEQLKSRGYELAEIIAAELERRDRTKH